uniref:Uncharacterized protein n=1 Tax=Heterosigma akashiwo TaxID=2829 RepID=A0A6S9KKZ4_HETAK|mmetsp:Transcript_31846/g.49970  ORF Transcript_31846/g.49970 Transcript_31846/m.49970 type:complete len:136 (+) Transcript_31846:118-525(+)
MRFALVLLVIFAASILPAGVFAVTDNTQPGTMRRRLQTTDESDQEKIKRLEAQVDKYEEELAALRKETHAGPVVGFFKGLVKFGAVAGGIFAIVFLCILGPIAAESGGGDVVMRKLGLPCIGCFALYFFVKHCVK